MGGGGVPTGGGGVRTDLNRTSRENKNLFSRLLMPMLNLAMPLPSDDGISEMFLLVRNCFHVLFNNVLPDEFQRHLVSKNFVFLK